MSFLKQDGSTPLTGNWDIGDGRRIEADQVRARDTDGVALYDANENGIIVKDGKVGINISNPGDPLEVDGNIYLNKSGAWLSVGTHNSTGGNIFFRRSSNHGFIGSNSGQIKYMAPGDHYFSSGKIGVGVSSPDTELDVDGALTLREKSADPPDPDEGCFVIWMSDGTGSGDDGDIMVKITAGGTTKTTTLIDFSAI